VTEANQTYYWKVVAKGGRYSTSSSVWSFTTGNQPGWFDLSTPAKGALGLPIEGDLTWQASDRATTYEVTLGSNTYTTSTNSYHYSGLSYGASYTWNVTAINNDGHTVSLNGPFSFSTSMEKILADCLYWKCDNSAYLWQTDKTGQSPKQVRAATWMGSYGLSPLAAMNPNGAAIVEMSYSGGAIRRHTMHCRVRGLTCQPGTMTGGRWVARWVATTTRLLLQQQSRQRDPQVQNIRRQTREYDRGRPILP
jgi:hypothetical protein